MINPNTQEWNSVLGNDFYTCLWEGSLKRIPAPSELGCLERVWLLSPRISSDHCHRRMQWPRILCPRRGRTQGCCASGGVYALLESTTDGRTITDHFSLSIYIYTYTDKSLQRWSNGAERELCCFVWSKHSHVFLFLLWNVEIKYALWQPVTTYPTFLCHHQ